MNFGEKIKPSLTKNLFTARNEVTTTKKWHQPLNCESSPALAEPLGRYLPSMQEAAFKHPLMTVCFVGDETTSLQFTLRLLRNVLPLSLAYPRFSLWDSLENNRFLSYLHPQAEKRKTQPRRRLHKRQEGNHCGCLMFYTPFAFIHALV